MSEFIGFTSVNRETTDYYFERFRYINRDQIDRDREAYHSFYLLDGTFIKKIYDIKGVQNKLTFDQFIFIGPANIMLLKEGALVRYIKWNNIIPEEFRIIRINEY